MMGNYSGKISNSAILTSLSSVTPLNDRMKSINSDQQPRKSEKKVSSVNRNLLLTIVAVEGKSLLTSPHDDMPHNLFCKFSLGSESYKTKAVPNTNRPEWRERFTFRLHSDDLLEISVWDKGRYTTFMGSCVLDLSGFERERTHNFWMELDEGHGSIHLSITICYSNPVESTSTQLFNIEDIRQRQNIIDFRSNWDLVGALYINVLGAKGLLGKPNAFCILELDNERVQTPIQKASSEPTWNKCYVFNVYDVTSTLDVMVYSDFFNELMGKVTIPLLMIINGEQRWYVLKDRNRGYSPKGNQPRVQLQMSLIWNPIKASLRVFRPKPVKYVRKPKKFDVALVHSNIEFIAKTFNFLYEINEGIKRLFEWDDAGTSLIALIAWIVFCFYLRLWTVPLFLLLPFIYHWFLYRYQNKNNHTIRNSNFSYGTTKNNEKVDKSITEKLQDLQYTTLTVTNGVEYLAAVAEKLHNLVSFKVPFLSYLSMVLLAITSLMFYFIPLNYLFMILGAYKYTRKYLNPDRVLNNDLLDFLSRVPNDEQLKKWKELNVPERVQQHPPDKLARSISTGVLPY